MARFTVPKHQIDSIVGRYHVSTDPAIVASELRTRLARAKWQGKSLTPSQVEKCIAYALKSHAANLSTYQFVMGGH